jgi:hypothetical protein
VNITAILVGILVIALAWYVTTGVLIYDDLRRRNVAVSFLFLRVLILKYVSQYKEITLKERGKVGPLFCHWTISIIVTLVSAILNLLPR